MRVSDYVVKFLERAGVEHVFTVYGGAIASLGDALVKEGMKYISCHHEQAAAMAAEGYARVREGVGAVFVTSGPGGTNAITGLVGCWTDHVPVMFFSGQSFLSQTIGSSGVRQKGVQEINIIDGVRPWTKYAAMVQAPKQIGWHMGRAFHESTTGRPGPVWLDLPADIQNSVISEVEPYAPHRGALLDAVAKEGRRRVKADALEVVEILRQSKRPLLHIGQGVRLAKAIPELMRFLENAKIPVVTARNGNDLIPSDHQLYIGRPGTFAQRGANFAVQSCDVYLAIGTRLSLAQTGYNSKDYARNAKVIQVDIDHAELHKDTVNVGLKVEADAREFLSGLNKNTKWPDWSDWWMRCKALQSKYPPVTDEQRKQKGFVNSYALIDLLSEYATSDDVIVTDMGFAFQNTAQAWRIKEGQRLIQNGGTAAMGWGLPAAIGAAIGSGRRVILIAGDGGLMMNIQELSTLAHHKLNVKIFLLNNEGYLTMRQSQVHAYGHHFGAGEKDLSFPNFTALARAHGIPSVKKYNLEIDGVLNSEGPVLCEVMMDPNQEQTPKSINRRLPDGAIKQTSIEDAYPFLPEEEIKENLTV